MKKAGDSTEITIDDTATNIIMHHLGSFQDNDLEALMTDYTNESVLITQEATYTTPEEIRGFFVNLMIYFPRKKSVFELDKLVANNELVYIVWHATTPSLNVPLGTDTFIIKNDKIFQQTFAGQLKFTGN